MVRDHGNPRIAVVLFQDGYRFIYILYCMLCQDGDCDITVRTLYYRAVCELPTRYLDIEIGAFPFAKILTTSGSADIK